MFTKEAIALARPCNEAIKKISEGKWEWKPRQGDLVIGKHDWIWLITVKTVNYLRLYRVYDGDWLHTTEMIKDCIPLLHWERIREVLKQVGYSFSITSGASGGQITVYKNVGTDKLYEKYHNNDLQYAVMQAVIELGKEI